MPTNRRLRGSRRRGASLDRFDQVEIDWLICTGKGFLERELDGNAKLIAEAWKYHGERVQREYIAGHPGRRTHAWWKLAAPEPFEAIERQFAEFDRQFDYPLANRPGEVWHRFQLKYLREHDLMEPAEAAAAAEREKADMEFNRRHWPDLFP